MLMIQGARLSETLFCRMRLRMSALEHLSSVNRKNKLKGYILLIEDTLRIIKKYEGFVNQHSLQWLCSTILTSQESWWNQRSDDKSWERFLILAKIKYVQSTSIYRPNESRFGLFNWLFFTWQCILWMTRPNFRYLRLAKLWRPSGPMWRSLASFGCTGGEAKYESIVAAHV